MVDLSEKGLSEVRAAIDLSLIRGTQHNASFSYEGVASGAERYVWIENPTDSGKVLLVAPPNFRSDSALRVQVDFNPTVDTQGNQITVRNRRSDNGDSVANAREGGDYTLNDPFPERPLGGGQGATAFASVDDTTAFTIAAGDSVLLIAESQNTDTDITLGVDFAELSENIVTVLNS
jgi:hypothetical protein